MIEWTWVLVAAVAGLVGWWAVSLVRLRRSIPKYAQYWQERAAQPGEFVYVALGDSAAQGIGTSDPDQSYVGRIARSIEKETGRTVRVINLSQTGAPTDDVMHRQLPELAKYSPDLVTLAIGGNDIRQFEAPKFERNIRTIIEQLPKGTFMADAPYFMHGTWEQSAIAMQAITEKVAREHGMHSVPLYAAMKREGWGSMFNAYAADWFHPNTRGYAVWYTSFWKAIRPTLESSLATNRDRV